MNYIRGSRNSREEIDSGDSRKQSCQAPETHRGDGCCAESRSRGKEKSKTGTRCAPGHVTLQMFCGVMGKQFCVGLIENQLS